MFVSNQPPHLQRGSASSLLRLAVPVLVDGNWTAVYGDIMDYMKRITIEPDKRSGQPCIRGLRMTVQDVLEYLASGMTVEEILTDFPDLTAEDIRACLEYAADHERRPDGAA
jgi:uncharacterized protein (DUF433 family)